MMNIFALALVLATLFSASVHSPAPPVKNQEDVIVKEGHRVVKVEFDEEGVGNTKVSISSNDQGHGHFGKSVKDKIGGVVGDAKEKLKEASSSLPNLGQGIGHKDDDGGGVDEGYGERASARELVCDALGKCTHRIASAFGKTKGVVSDKAQEVAGKMNEIEEDAKETASEAMGRAKDAATKSKSRMEDAAEMVTEQAKQATNLAGDAARNTKSRMEGVAEMAKESVTEKAKQASDLAGEAAKQTKSTIEGGAKETAEMAKTLSGDVKSNASEKTEEVSEKVKHGAEKVEGEGKEGVERLRRRTSGLWTSMFDSLRSYMRILQLFGVATAYGMSMWVTFLSSFVLARVLPRQQFANAQSKIYPIYFKAMAYSVGLALLGHMLSEGQFRKLAALEDFQALNLVSSLGMILANLLYFEPRATKVMFERLKWEKEEGRGLHATPAATTVTTVNATEASNIRLVDSASNIRSVDSAVPPTARTTTEATATTKTTSDAMPLQMIELSEALKKLNSNSSFLNVLTLMGLTLHLVHLGQRLGTAC